MKAINPLYIDIVINLDLLDILNDEFVPVGITSRILQCKPDISKWEGYAINLESDNFENKLNHVGNTASLNISACLGGCLYTDIDNAWKHLTTKLISVVENHKDSGISIDHASKVLLLTYQNKSYMKPLNDWDNPDFFTSVFPTLFLFGIGGYLTKKDESGQIRVSFQSLAK